MAATTEVWRGPDDLRPLLVPIESLAPHPRNPRKHARALLDESFERFGQQKPIVVLPNRWIVAGHGTWNTLRDQGWTHIAIVKTDLEEGEAERFLLMDNRSSDVSTYDEAVLAELLQELEERGALEGTGYSPDDLERLVATLAELTYQPDGPEQPRLDERNPDSGEPREVVLTLTAEQYEKFSTFVRMIGRAWEKEGVTEVVVECLTRAAASL